MKVDIGQIEALNYVFLRVMGQIFLATPSNPTLNDMSGAQKRILYFLDLKGPKKMSEIARLVGVTVPAATGVVDKLVRSGLVRRESDSEDRRVIRIALTPTGRRSLSSLKRIHEKRLREVLERLPGRKRAELVSAFERIHELLCEIEENPACAR